MNKGPTPEWIPQIGPATAQDYSAIVDLLSQCGLPTADLSPTRLDGFQVARRDDDLAGVAGLERHGRHGLLRSVAVAPAFRGNGLGAALVNVIEAGAARSGLQDLYLLTESAEQFFQARGYAAVSRACVPDLLADSSEFRQLCPASAIVMRRALTGTP